MKIVSGLFIMLQFQIIKSEEESLLWNSRDKSVNLIAPNYLPESKKENRRLAVVMKGEVNQSIKMYFQITVQRLDKSKFVMLTCVMNGFEGNDTSKPKWTTDFQDDQIDKEENGPSWTKDGYAGWDINVTISEKDSGDKVSESV